MKKKVALLLVLVMIVASLPMNLFGTAVPVVPSTTPQAIDVTGTAITNAQIAALTAGSYLIRVTVTNATITSPAAFEVNPSIPSIAGVGSATVRYFDATGIVLPAGPWDFTVEDVTVSANATMSVELVPVVGAPVATGANIILPFGTPIAIAGATMPGTLSEVPGVVRNPIQTPDAGARSFTITLNMNQLHGQPTPVANQTARLLLELLGPNSGGNRVGFASMGVASSTAGPVEFETNNAGNFRTRPVAGGAWSIWRNRADTEAAHPGIALPTAANMWTPIVRVHEDSQIFVGPPGNNEMVTDPASLFTSGLPGTSAAGTVGYLATSAPFNDRQSLEAWLALSAQGHALINSTLGTAVGTPHIRNLTGTLVLEISGITAAAENARINTHRIGAFADPDVTIGRTTLVNNQLLVFSTQGVGVTINGAAARHFVSGLILPQISITEWAPQSLHHAWVSGGQGGTFVGQAANSEIGGALTQHVRLLGPRDYLWNVGVQHLVNPLTVSDPHGIFGGATVTADIVNYGIDGPTGRPFIILALAIPNRGPHPAQNQRARLDIDGLALIPTRDDVPYGNVYVDIAFGHWSGGVAATNTITWVPIISPVLSNLLGGQRGLAESALITLGQNRGVQVGSPSVVESANAIYAATTGLNLLDITQAVLGAVPGAAAADRPLEWFPTTGTPTGGAAGAWATRGDNWRNPAKHVGIRGAASLVLETHDDIPDLISGQSAFPGPAWNNTQYPQNYFDNARTARVQLRELAPGALNLGWTASVAEFYLPEEIRDGVQFVHAAWRVYPGTDWHHVTVSYDDVHAPPTAIGAASLTRNSLRVFIPRHETPATARRLDVFFYVSIRAGFEADFDGADLDIAVRGSAATNLAIDNTTVTAASIVDPIQVELLGELLPIDVGQVMSPTEVTSIPDIRISELDWGRLPRGTTFNIGIAAIPIPVLGNHAFMSNSGVIVCEDGSGLEVRATQHTTANGQVMSMSFEVIRESQEGRGPGTIVLENNRIMGTFLPGIQYGISVTAPAVAANTGRGMTGRGNFDWIPYFAEIIEFGDFDYEGLPPGVGEPGAHVPGRELRLWEGMPSLADIDIPFYWEIVGNNRVGMVSLRVFAEEFLGTEPAWDAGNARATITGYDFNGNWVSVVLEVGNHRATVSVDSPQNYEFVDIATFVSYLSGPANTVVPTMRHNRMYLPLRFVANAFGLTTEMVGDVVIVR